MTLDSPTAPSTIAPAGAFSPPRWRQQWRDGRCSDAYQVLGAHPAGDGSWSFSVFAPNAVGVSVSGDFCAWRFPGEPLAPAGDGFFSARINGIQAGQLYRLRIETKDGWLDRTDPFGRAFELRPGHAARVTASRHLWGDQQWLQQREKRQQPQSPISIYELHLGSWRRHPSGRWLNYRNLAGPLVQHVLRLGFTHVEFMPLTEHLLDESWGYQGYGFFAPTSRYGSPDDLRWLIDQLHQHGIGVILDWTPAHFAPDTVAVARFDGTHLFETGEPHELWRSAVFDLTQGHVRSLLLSSAMYWLREFHFDGLRVDAVSSLLYRNYAHLEGDASNAVSNPGGLQFLQTLTDTAHREAPGTLLIAEVSTASDHVTEPVSNGGLGFDYKWNLGWMQDTLHYLKTTPDERSRAHERLTFPLTYAFDEHFILPLSHDEVVHEKRALLGKPAGDLVARVSQLKMLFALQWLMPGKKLLFMGGEFGSDREWVPSQALPWQLCSRNAHRELLELITALNRLYRTHAALQVDDLAWQNFRWLDCDDRDGQFIAFTRQTRSDCLVALFNFNAAPQQRTVPVTDGGRYAIKLNTHMPASGGLAVDDHVIAEWNDALMGDAFTLAMPGHSAVLLARKSLN